MRNGATCDLSDCIFYSNVMAVDTARWCSLLSHENTFEFD